MPQDRDWLTVGALVAAAFVGGIAAQQAERLATATIDATAHADGASEKQHLDTLAALKIASDANTLSKETADRQARETASALELSKQAADAAAKAVETNVASERARLFLTNASFVRTNEKDPNPKISFQIANLGKTTALVTELAYECQVAPNTGQYNLPLNYKPHMAMTVILPGTPYTTPPNLFCVMDAPISDTDFAGLDARTKVIFLTGYVKFQDVFGENFIKYFGAYNFGKDNDFFGITPFASQFNSEVKDQ
jgi:hypothetical protein